MKKRTVLFLFILLLPEMILAYAGSEFLLLDTSTRAAALGGAHASVINGINSIYYNAASINSIKKVELTFENISFLNDMNFKFLACGSRLLDIPFGLSVGLYSMSDISIYGPEENLDRVISCYDLFASMSTGYNFNEFLTGINIKYIHRSIDEYTASGIAVDLGVIRRFSLAYPAFFKNDNKDNLGLGLAVKNLSPGLKFNNEREDPPLDIVVGVNSKFIKNSVLTLAVFLDTGKILNDDLYIKSGLEIGITELVYLRIGKSFLYNDTITTGLALHFPLGEKTQSQFNYSIISIPDLGLSHVVGGTIIF